MAKYLIQVSQPAETAARSVDASVRAIGSHFATHATWLHRDGIATASLVVEADDRRWAIGVVPPNMRPDARIVQIGSGVSVPSVSTSYALAA